MNESIRRGFVSFCGFGRVGGVVVCCWFEVV